MSSYTRGSLINKALRLTKHIWQNNSQIKQHFQNCTFKHATQNIYTILILLLSKKTYVPKCTNETLLSKQRLQMNLCSWENAGLYFSALHHFFEAKQLKFTFTWDGNNIPPGLSFPCLFLRTSVTDSSVRP